MLLFACMTLMVGTRRKEEKRGERNGTSLPRDSWGTSEAASEHVWSYYTTLTRIFGIALRTTFLLYLTDYPDLECDVHVPHEATPDRAAQSVLLKLHRFQPRRAAARVTFSLDHWCEALRCTCGLTHLSITASQSADKIILDPG